MKLSRRLTLLLVACSGIPTASGAEPTYPTQPIHLVVPTAPGGSYDVLARQLAGKLGPQLGQPIIVENRSGAGTVVGTQAVAQAPADGYTLLLGGLSNIVLNNGLYDRLPYRTEDLVPLGIVGATSYTLVARPDLPVKSLRELVDYAKVNPGKLTIATAGIGTGQHVVAALLKSTAGIDLAEIPYKGAQPVYTDLFGGRVDVFFDSTATAKPFIDAGKVRALVNSGPKRDALAPQVPTARESGFDGLVMEGWLGLFAPIRTPPMIVEKLRASLVEATRSPEFRAKLQGYGIRPLTMTKAETDDFIQAEARRWPPFLRRAGIKAD